MSRKSARSTSKSAVVLTAIDGRRDPHDGRLPFRATVEDEWEAADCSDGDVFVVRNTEALMEIARSGFLTPEPRWNGEGVMALPISPSTTRGLM